MDPGCQSRSHTFVPGDVTVSRTDSWWDERSGYTWTISFPLTARNAPELGFDGAALEGKGAAGNIVETQEARVPEVQRVSTVASSEVYGSFTLFFFGEETEQLRHNATAEEVRTTLRGGILVFTDARSRYYAKQGGLLLYTVLVSA